MNIWVMSMWIFSSLLACWSFSLLMRWISEMVARRRRQLIAQRSSRSYWLALALVLVCAAGSVLAGIMAVYLESQFTGRQPWTSRAAIVGGFISVFGFFMLISTFVGDRSRGRTRCPKCWYDMSDASGLLCPECGHTSKSKNAFGNTRRGKRGAAFGLCLLIMGMYPMTLNKKLAQYGNLTLVPTWVLMLGWDTFPDTWISVYKRGGSRANLRARIRDDWISDERSHRFADRLLRPMLTDKQARWDEQRIDLIGTAYDNGETWISFPLDRPTPLPNDIDFEELLRVVALDMLDAMTAQNPTALDLTIASSYGHTDLGLYNIVWSWILRHHPTPFASERYSGSLFYIEFMRSREIYEVISDILADVRPQFDTEAFISLIPSPDKQIRDTAYRLSLDTGLLDQRPEIFFVAEDELGKQSTAIRYHLGTSLHLLKPESQTIAFLKLSQWIRSDDAGKRMFAITAIQYLQNNVGFNKSNPLESYQQVINDILTHGIGDDRKPYTDRTNVSIDWIATRVIVRYDTDGTISFPILLDRDSKSKPLTGNISWHGKEPEDFQRMAQYWLESFEGMLDSPRISTRRWVIDNLPQLTGSSYDERFNAIALACLNDTDELVRASAHRKLVARNALYLIPDDYDPEALSLDEP